MRALKGKQVEYTIASPLHAGEWSTSRPGLFTALERTAETYWRGGCVISEPVCTHCYSVQYIIHQLGIPEFRSVAALKTGNRPRIELVGFFCRPGKKKPLAFNAPLPPHRINHITTCVRRKYPVLHSCFLTFPPNFVALRDLLRRVEVDPALWTAYIRSVSSLTTVRSLFQSEFSIENHLVLPLLISRILSFSQGHPVAAYFFFVAFPSRLSFHLSFNNVL